MQKRAKALKARRTQHAIAEFALAKPAPAVLHVNAGNVTAVIHAAAKIKTLRLRRVFFLTYNDKNKTPNNTVMNQVHHHHSNPVTAVSGNNPPDLRTETSRSELFKLALSATFHCLVGCGIGEVAGMIISMAFGLSNLHSILLTVILGFIAGMALGILPLMRFGFSLRKALKTVIAGEGLSIAVMEAFEVMTVLVIPGVMTAHLTDLVFWTGMLAALAVGFVAAFPVNYFFIKRGIRHQH